MKIRRPTLALLAFTCLSADAAAEKLFQWQDETGQLHFSDIPPAGQAALEREVHYAAPGRWKRSGLRSGELEMLKTMAQRTSRQSRKARDERRHNDRRVNEKRKQCSNDRDLLLTTRNRAKRKHYAQKLRKECG